MTRTPIRCLIVEDNEDDEELVVLELRRGGYDVVHRRVDTEAGMRSALAGDTWDVVISDFSMPEFSAPRALNVLRGLGLDTPFIIVSGTVGEEAAVAAMRSGANDYVLKGNLIRLYPAVERERREAESRAERRKMREQLLISERMASVGVLAAGVAHEINNPLAAVIANLELASNEIRGIAAELKLEPRFQGVFAELHDATECAGRVRGIVRDLKVFSRLPDEEQRGPVNVASVLDSSLRLAWNEIRHRAQLVKEYSEVPPVEANDARLGQVFLNLIVNAAHAIPEGDAEGNWIRVVTLFDASRNRVIIEFWDSGSGIPEENIPVIFEAFFTTKSAGAGTGLGLAICHKIISNLGGDIQVESQVGRGTVVRVALPASTARSEEKILVSSVVVARRRGSVLVVDDEVVVARAIGRMLEREHSVTVTESAVGALQRIQSGERFDVILCDLMMPQMTGVELYAEVLRVAPEQAAKMVFLTGGAFTPGARAFISEVGIEWVEKPFDRQLLKNVVNSRVNAEEPISAA